MISSLKKTYLGLSVISLSIIVVIYGATMAFGWPTVYADSVYMLAPTLAIWAFVRALQQAGGGKRGKILALFTLGLCSFWVGELIFVILSAYELSPYPSVADVFYLLAYPFMFAGLYIEYRLAKVKLEANLLPGLIAGVIALVAVVGYFDLVLAFDAEDSFLGNAVSSLYGIGDISVLLMAIGVGLVARGYKGGQLVFALRPVMIGLAFYLAADTFYSMVEVQYNAGFGPYSFIDLLWVIGYLYIGYSAAVYLDVLGNVKGLLKLRGLIG